MLQNKRVDVGITGCRKGIAMKNEKPVLTQSDRFKAAARELGADESEAAFDATLRKIGERKAPADGRKVCPECHHVFQGNGWDGIDAHWRSKHEEVMPYEEAWPLLLTGKYRPK